MFSDDKITELYCSIHDFCNEFEPILKKRKLPNGKKQRNRAFVMSVSEILTITVLFHMSDVRTFKSFYINQVQKVLKNEFPNTVSYNRFTELMQINLFPLVLYLKTCCLGKCTGISFIDSTPLRVCNKKRIRRNKVFENVAKIGKSTMGWFYGFKLHILINDKGEILEFNITKANVDDRTPLKSSSFLKKIFGKIYADKGYISKELADLLFADGLHLVTSIKKNMKNILMPLRDKILLRKRSIIETINDQLKNICQIEHSRHRSVTNFISNLIAGLIAYSFKEKKPSIKYQSNQCNHNQLQLFC